MHGAASVAALIDMVEDKELNAEIISLSDISWPASSIGRIMGDYVRLMQDHKRERTIDRLKGELKIAEEKGDEEKARELTAEIGDLIKRRVN